MVAVAVDHLHHIGLQGVVTALILGLHAGVELHAKCLLNHNQFPALTLAR